MIIFEIDNEFHKNPVKVWFFCKFFITISFFDTEFQKMSNLMLFLIYLRIGKIFLPEKMLTEYKNNSFLIH